MKECPTHRAGERRWWWSEAPEELDVGVEFPDDFLSAVEVNGVVHQAAIYEFEAGDHYLAACAQSYETRVHLVHESCLTKKPVDCIACLAVVL